jgi:large subunit ribosomal protein L25
MELVLEAQKRSQIGKKINVLRNSGKVPAVLYGNGIKNINLEIDAKQLKQIFDEAGVSSLVSIKIDGEKSIKVLFKEPQLHYLNGSIMHVDMYQVNMKEKIKTEIPIEFIGESIAVTENEGKLVTSLDAIEVECLPDDLVPHIEVDISKLVEFEDSIHVSELNIPAGIEVLTDPELVVCVVQAPLSEEELAAELAEDEKTEEEAVAEVEVDEKKSDEDAEGADTEDKSSKSEE